MSIIVVHVLCEGQTEERFVSKVLHPFLRTYNIVAKPTLLYTNKGLDAKGGMISYEQAKCDLENLVKGIRHNDYEKHYFTTMFDLYALPSDFPGNDLQSFDYNFKVHRIEDAFKKDINCEFFIPYIELHEFETLVLCNVPALIAEYPKAKRQLEIMDSSWRRLFNNVVEKVNTSKENAPSKRIIKAISKYYKYDKVKSGTSVTSDYGIEQLRKQCPHFDEWVSKLLELCKYE